MEYIYSEPRDFSDQGLVEFCDLVMAGGQVMRTNLGQRVKNAKHLVTSRHGVTLTGVAALKIPLLSYQEKIFNAARVDIEPSTSILEMGWFFTKPNYRQQGIASGLVKLIDNKLGSSVCISTTRLDNAVMRHILTKYNFKPLGVSYPGRLECEIQLFIRGRK
jgi:predicted GNAT family acetyltransferase